MKVWSVVLLPPGLLMLLPVLRLLNIVRMPLRLVGRIDPPTLFPPVTVIGLLEPETVAMSMNVQGNAYEHA
ncbi:hypothetical protein [Streptomyces sp. NPDC005262]|uniref:hypothetical protein n=1 Tax=Streptomyces sp. NPDC005262 TaxID=3364710 RepID=UPI00369A6277